MKQEEVFKRIGGILKELSDQYEYLETTIGNLNSLELELFVSNAHFLADHIEILNKLNLQNSEAAQASEIQETPDRKYFEPVVQQVRHEGAEESAKSSKPVEIEVTNFRPDEDHPIQEIDLAPDMPEETVSVVKEEPETIRHELIMDDAEDWEDDEYHETVELDDITDEETDLPVAKEEYGKLTGKKDPEIRADKHEKEIISEKKGEDLLTINQKISSQLGDKATGRTEQPISDIKGAITLNDKLLFVKDLFNGYSLAYTEAIEILNRFTTFDEALRFLKTNYVTKNDWEGKPATTEKFYALLRRRYA
jgi:hypothetical protein